MIRFTEKPERKTSDRSLASGPFPDTMNERRQRFFSQPWSGTIETGSTGSALRLFADGSGTIETGSTGSALRFIAAGVRNDRKRIVRICAPVYCGRSQE